MLGEGTSYDKTSECYLRMPSYCYRRKIPPSDTKENPADVKARLVLELAQRTETRVKYWEKREAWCRARPGRRLIIGWGPIAVPDSDSEQPVWSNSSEVSLETSPTNVHTSCIETPD